MEQVLACLTPLVRHLLIRRDDGITNGALRLALQSAHNVSAECHEAVDDTSILCHASLDMPYSIEPCLALRPDRLTENVMTP